MTHFLKKHFMPAFIFALIFLPTVILFQNCSSKSVGEDKTQRLPKNSDPVESLGQPVDAEPQTAEEIVKENVTQDIEFYEADSNYSVRQRSLTKVVTRDDPLSDNVNVFIEVKATGSDKLPFKWKLDPFSLEQLPEWLILVHEPNTVYNGNTTINLKLNHEVMTDKTYRFVIKAIPTEIKYAAPYELPITIYYKREWQQTASEIKPTLAGANYLTFNVFLPKDFSKTYHSKPKGWQQDWMSNFICESFPFNCKFVVDLTHPDIPINLSKHDLVFEDNVMGIQHKVTIEINKQDASIGGSNQYSRAQSEFEINNAEKPTGTNNQTDIYLKNFGNLPSDWHFVRLPNGVKPSVYSGSLDAHQKTLLRLTIDRDLFPIGENIVPLYIESKASGITNTIYAKFDNAPAHYKVINPPPVNHSKGALISNLLELRIRKFGFGPGTYTVTTSNSHLEIKKTTTLPNNEKDILVWPADSTINNIQPVEFIVTNTSHPNTITQKVLFAAHQAGPQICTDPKIKVNESCNRVHLTFYENDFSKKVTLTNTGTRVAYFNFPKINGVRFNFTTNKINPGTQITGTMSLNFSELSPNSTYSQTTSFSILDNEGNRYEDGLISYRTVFTPPKGRLKQIYRIGTSSQGPGNIGFLDTLNRVGTLFEDSRNSFYSYLPGETYHPTVPPIIPNAPFDKSDLPIIDVVRSTHQIEALLEGNKVYNWQCSGCLPQTRPISLPEGFSNQTLRFFTKDIGSNMLYYLDKNGNIYVSLNPSYDHIDIQHLDLLSKNFKTLLNLKNLSADQLIDFSVVAASRAIDKDKICGLHDNKLYCSDIRHPEDNTKGYVIQLDIEGKDVISYTSAISGRRTDAVLTSSGDIYFIEPFDNVLYTTDMSTYYSAEFTSKDVTTGNGFNIFPLNLIDIDQSKDVFLLQRDHQ